MDEGTANQESEAVHISDIKKFQPLFWLLSLSCVVVYGCVLPFNNVASGILLERNFFTAPPECHLTFQDQCADGCKCILPLVSMGMLARNAAILIHNLYLQTSKAHQILQLMAPAANAQLPRRRHPYCQSQSTIQRMNPI